MVGVKVGEKHSIQRAHGHADLIEPYSGAAADVEQQPLSSRLNQRRRAEPVGNGEGRAGPEQRHLEILRPCRRRNGETGGQDRKAPSDAHITPPCVCRGASLSSNSLQRKGASWRADAPCRRAAFYDPAGCDLPYCSTCTFSSVTRPLEIMPSSTGRKASIFSCESTISMTIGRSCERRKILVVWMWLEWPKPIGPRRTVAPASCISRALSRTAS